MSCIEPLVVNLPNSNGVAGWFISSTTKFFPCPIKAKLPDTSTLKDVPPMCPANSTLTSSSLEMSGTPSSIKNSPVPGIYTPILSSPPPAIGISPKSPYFGVTGSTLPGRYSPILLSPSPPSRSLDHHGSHWLKYGTYGMAAVMCVNVSIMRIATTNICSTRVILLPPYILFYYTFHKYHQKIIQLLLSLLH